MITICPNCCHQFDTSQVKSGKRICSECKKPIGRHDKWFFRPDGRIQHRHCDDPEQYVKKSINPQQTIAYAEDMARLDGKGGPYQLPTDDSNGDIGPDRENAGGCMGNGKEVEIKEEREQE